MKGPIVVEGLTVIVKGNFEKALRIFSKKVQSSGLIRELREREHFEKPASKRKKAKLAARMRERKRSRDEMPSKN
jgi:small subunit ribosomal protein S21